jgi:type VI secretion system protein ImpL
MSRTTVWSDAIALGIFWSPILLAWGMVWYRFRSAPGMAVWIALGIILGLIGISSAWLVVKMSRTGWPDPLPWYLVVGLPAVGKTTLLKTSGLRPLSVQNDDSYIAHRSIILEGVGGYVLDDVQDADADTRNQFLADLQQFLRTRALKGVIATVEVDAALDVEGNQKQAQTLRDHLNEITGLFGVQVPVYLVITKCDCLPGFLPFFANLPPGARAQVWGTALPVGCQGGPVAAFERECHILQGALDERRLGYMGSESVTANRAVYQFPARFQTLCHALNGFVKTLLSPEMGQNSLTVRGCYWTSAAQPEAQGQQYSYFVKELLSQVIKGDQGLTQPTGEAMRRRWTRRMALSTIAALLGTLLVWALPQIAI